MMRSDRVGSQAPAGPVSHTSEYQSIPFYAKGLTWGTIRRIVDTGDRPVTCTKVTRPMDTISPAMRQRQRELSADNGYTVTPPTPEALAHQAEARARRKAQRDANETGFDDPRFPAPRPIQHAPALSPFALARAAARRAELDALQQAENAGTEDLDDLDRYLPKDGE